MNTGVFLLSDFHNSLLTDMIRYDKDEQQQQKKTFQKRIKFQL